MLQPEVAPLGADQPAAVDGDIGLVTHPFERKFQHRLIRRAVNGAAVDPGDTQTDSSWSVLPIQNAVQASMKDCDWHWLTQRAAMFRVLKMEVHCRAFQFRSYDVQNGAITTQAVPNQYLQVYVDKQLQMPGYEQNFYDSYSTNNLYQYADMTDNVLNQDDITLQEWSWFNSSRAPIEERLQLNVWNSDNDASFINQTGVFDWVWQAEGHAR